MEKLSMQEVQSVSLEILKKVSDICDRLHLKYALAYGTLIGAIRHHDFIPWDDDIDIWMPRADYETLLDYFEKHKETLLPLKVFNRKTIKGYPYMITRISDDRYELDVHNEDNYGIGVFIDIYVSDGLGKTLQEARAIIAKTAPLTSLMFLSTRKKFDIGLTKGLKARLCKLPVYMFSKLMGKDYWGKKIENIVNPLKWDDSNYTGCAIWGGRYLARGICPKSYYDDLIKCKFGKYEFYIFAEYDKVLRNIYGDYMQLPPENERIYKHLYTAYKK